MINIFKLHRYFAFFQPSLGGAEGLILSAALSGVGALMQQNSANDAAKKQQRIISQAAEADARTSERRQNVVQNFAADNFSADKRDANYEQGAAENESSLVSALKRANEASGNESAKSMAEGNLSADYLRAKGTATAESTADILRRAKLLGRANASSLLYNKDAMAGSNLSADMAGFDSEASRNRGYTNTKLGNVRNRGSLVGGLLTAAAPMAGMYANTQFGGGGLPTGFENLPKYVA